jgi:hypothetical protein
MEEYKTFLTTAPDNAAFTQMKVVTIIAINTSAKRTCAFRLGEHF